MAARADPAKLQAKIECLKREIAELEAALGRELVDKAQDTTRDHIQLLHRYNDLKDGASIFLGRLASLQGVTVASIYKQYDLSLDD